MSFRVHCHMIPCAQHAIQYLSTNFKLQIQMASIQFAEIAAHMYVVQWVCIVEVACLWRIPHVFHAQMDLFIHIMCRVGQTR